MAIHYIQPSFAGGEIAPALRSRVDLQKYATAVARATNFFAHPQGGMSNRPGTRWIASTKDSQKRARLIPFKFSSNQSYMLEFGDEYIRFYQSGAQIQYGVDPYEIESPWTEDELFLLDFNQSADVVYLCTQGKKQQTLTRNDSTDWVLADYEGEGGPFMLSNTDEDSTITADALTGSCALTATEEVFNLLHVGALWRLIHPVESQTVAASLGSATSTSSIKCGGTWRLITHGTWTAKIQVEKSTDNGVTWNAMRSFSSVDDYNTDTFGDLGDDDFALVRVTCYDYTSGTCAVDLSTDAFSQIGIVRITGFTDTKHVAADIIEALGSTDATFDWAEGSWSDYRGYPACSLFVQDRLAFANTRAEPQTAWLSQPSDYVNFSRHIPLVDSDGITVNLPSREVNGVQRMVGMRDVLLALTSSADWSVGPSDSGIFTPTSVKTSLEGYNGASSAAPCLVKNRAIIAQPMGTVIRDLGFDLTTGFTGDSINIMAAHLFEGKQVVGMAYAQEPHSVLHVFLDDGTLLACTYMKEQEVIAWAPQETDGLVESVATIPGDGYDEVWLIVNRNGDRFVERFDPRLASTDPADQFFVDSGLSLDEPKDIGAASKANPCVLSVVGHGFEDGDLVDVKGVLGMTQLNGRRFIVANSTADDFKLKTTAGTNVNSSAYTTYISGGEVRKVVDQVTGLQHLEGRTVAILANGNVYPQQVVEGGAVDISPAASIVHVGLPYTATLETLALELQQNSGTLQGKKIKIPSVTIRLLNSRGGKVGRDDDHLDSIIQRRNENYGAPIELFTGEHKKTISSTYKSGGAVVIQQADPLPMTVLAVIPTVSIGG
jgi:hypothetical protein